MYCSNFGATLFRLVLLGRFWIQCNINDTVRYTLFKNCIIINQRIIDKIDNQKFIENIYSLQPKVSHQFKLAMSP